MAPKTKRARATSTRPESSRAEARRNEDPASVPYDATVFASGESRERHLQIQGRPFVPERGFILPIMPQEVGERIAEIIDSRRWRRFSRVPDTVGNCNMVLEFYSNFPERKNHPQRHVMVRGKEFPINSEVINAFYNTPNVPVSEDQFHRFGNVEVDYDDVLRELAVAGAQWRMVGGVPRLAKGQLTRHSKVWLYFVSSRLYPLLHYTEVPKQTMFLLYAIFKNFSIDIGRIIYNQMNAVTYDSGRSTLPFPQLITALCKRAGCQEDVTDVKVYVAKTLNSAYVATLKDPAPAEIEAPPAQRDELPPPVFQRMMQSYLERVGEQCQHIIGQVSGVEGYLHRQAAYGAGLVDSLNQLCGRLDINSTNPVEFGAWPTYEPYPHQAPQWPPQWQNPGDGGNGDPGNDGDGDRDGAGDPDIDNLF